MEKREGRVWCLGILYVGQEAKQRQEMGCSHFIIVTNNLKGGTSQVPRLWFIAFLNTFFLSVWNDSSSEACQY